MTNSRIFKILLLVIVVVSPVWVMQTANTEPIDDNPYDIYLPLIMDPPIMLKNGNFEGGGASWNQYSLQGWPLIVHRDNLAVSPHNGNWAAWLGGDYNEDAVLWQEITITAYDSILTYWLWIGSEDDCGYDVGGVSIDLNVVDSYWLCLANGTGGWSKRTVDLSAFKGQTVDLEFVAFTDGSYNSNLFLDDVSLDNISIDLYKFDQSTFQQANLYQPKPVHLRSIQNGDQTAFNMDERLQLITALAAAAD